MPTHAPADLAAHRRRTGLTGAQVAHLLGVNKSTLSRWETGAMSISYSQLADLSAVYGCSLAELVTPAPALA